MWIREFVVRLCLLVPLEAIPEQPNQHELNKAKLHKDKSTMSGSYISNCRQLRRAGRGRAGPCQGRAHQGVVHCQMVSSANIRANKVMVSQQVIFRNTYVYTNTYMHFVPIGGEKRHGFRREWEGVL